MQKQRRVFNGTWVPFQKGQAGQGGSKPKEHPQLSTNTLHHTGKGTSQPPSPISAHEGFMLWGNQIRLGDTIILTSPHQEMLKQGDFHIQLQTNPRGSSTPPLV